MGREDLIDKVIAGDILSTLRDIAALGISVSVAPTGLVLLFGAILYHLLPWGIVPSFIPILGGLDRHFAKLVGLMGIGLLFVAFH